MKVRDFLIGSLIFVVFYSTTFNFAAHVKAFSLIDGSVINDIQTPVTNAKHTFSFKTGNPGVIKQINIQYGESSGSNTKPPSMFLGDASFNIVTGLNAGDWSIDLSQANSGLVKLKSGIGDSKSAGEQVTFELNNVFQPEIGECTTSGDISDSCFVYIATYSDDGNSLIDDGGYMYSIADQPELSFTIAGVHQGEIHNGITASVDTQFNVIDFGELEMRKPKYASQQLFVKTTAPHGYVVRMKLDGYLQGLHYVNKIDPFYSSWADPQAWNHPYGIAPNPTYSEPNDTGWLGANTTDGRVDSYIDPEGNNGNHWHNSFQKFGPVSSVWHPVMYSQTKDYGTSAYVTYAIETTENQPPDSYMGSIEYSIIATY